jgi:hypothetical protein
VNAELCALQLYREKKGLRDSKAGANSLRKVLRRFDLALLDVGLSVVVIQANPTIELTKQAPEPELTRDQYSDSWFYSNVIDWLAGLTVSYLFLTKCVYDENIDKVQLPRDTQETNSKRQSQPGTHEPYLESCSSHIIFSKCFKVI